MLLNADAANDHLIEQLATRERLLAAIIEHSPTGILLMDRAGRVLFQNPVVNAMLGPVERVGEPFAELLPLHDEAGQPIAVPLPDDGAPLSAQGYLPARDGGRDHYVQVTVTALRHGHNDNAPWLEGYIVNLVDLTPLQQAERARTIFLAGLSHELKTPLALIRGYAETLRYPQVHEDAAMYEEALDVILTETAHLTEMVNHLLLAARLQAGAVQLELHEIALDRLLHKLVDEYRAAHPGYQWRLDLSGGLQTVVADPERIRAVFHNLLSNAVKYSRPGTRITITGEQGPDSVRVRVQDEGIGISAEDQARLFQRFSRLSDRAEGTGLGLYLSKAIVEAHGGRIIVESEEGVGSAFTVVLPARASERAVYPGS